MELKTIILAAVAASATIAPALAHAGPLAKPVAIATAPEGAHIDLFSIDSAVVAIDPRWKIGDRCKGEPAAEGHLTANGKADHVGCWVALEDKITILWHDGSATSVPITEFKTTAYGRAVMARPAK
ncbi:hypothetical protein [Cupriavidus necator]